LLDGLHAPSSVIKLRSRPASPCAFRNSLSTAADCKPRLMRFLSRRSAEMALGVLLALAILLRLQPILVEPSAVWPDEIFQTSEPAHAWYSAAGWWRGNSSSACDPGCCPALLPG
jgi:hypothetical protein